MTKPVAAICAMASLLAGLACFLYFVMGFAGHPPFVRVGSVELIGKRFSEAPSSQVTPHS
jgi:hypothetical protein